MEVVLMRFWIIAMALAAFLIATTPVMAQETGAACAPEDTDCLLLQLETEAGKIETVSWRDQTYRELAKLLAHEKKLDRAIALIDKIQSPDTKAMTIRGIGMAAADENFTADEYRAARNQKTV